MSNNRSNNSDTLQFVDNYQTRANAGTYTVSVQLTVPDALKTEGSDLSNPISNTIHLHVAGPRFSLPTSAVHSVFPPENGIGDYNNVLPHVVLNRHTLPWERLAAGKREEVPFLALLVFTEDEELSGQVTPPKTLTLEELGYYHPSKALREQMRTHSKWLEPGEKLTDKASVIAVKPKFLRQILPTADDLSLLAHGRAIAESSESGDTESGDTEAGDTESSEVTSKVTHQRAVVIANRLPESPADSTTTTGETPNAELTPPNIPRRCHIAHLVMLEDRYDVGTGQFKFEEPDAIAPVQLVCLKSWQFICSKDKPTLNSRLIENPDFSFDTFRVLFKTKGNENETFETLRDLSYTALPYHLRWGDRTHTLYHGPLVANSAENESLENDVPVSADSLVRLLAKEHIFDVSLAAAWQLGQLMLLRDQDVAMAYLTWRRAESQRQAKHQDWEQDHYLQWEDQTQASLSPLPKSVQTWFQDRLALKDIPFEYLVPDINMLPYHSLRVFHIHQRWMECFISGALSLGRVGEADRQQEAIYRQQILPAEDIGKAGFLLYSPAVDEHPDLQAAAFGPNKQLDDIRLERLAPNLLFGLYRADVISKLEFSLPPIGLHFGLTETGDDFTKDVKDPHLPKNVVNKFKEFDTILNQDDQRVVKEQRVVDISYLKDEMTKILQANKRKKYSKITSGRFAFQMVEGTEMVVFEID